MGARRSLVSLVIAVAAAFCIAGGMALTAFADPQSSDGQDLTAGSTALTTQGAGEASGIQTADSKPLQAIQATSMSVFTTDKGKNLNAKVVEPASGGGALSYNVKSGGDCVDVGTDGALTFKKAGTATVTVTAAATDTYAQTSVDVPVRIYDTYKYEVSFWTIQYSTGYRIYNLSSLDIKLFDKSGKEVGRTTVENPKKGNKVEVLATNFADRVEMTAHIQLPKQAPITLTGSGGIGGSINVWNPSSHSGKVFTCNYGMNAPEPDCAAPVAKTNLTANGTKQTLIYPGSVSAGGQMQYCLGTASEPHSDQWSTGVGSARAVNPGTYYVWWRTHNYYDYRSARYIGHGRSEMAPQRIEVTIGKGTISPSVSIDGWTYGEEAKTPTVTGNTGNGTVTYSYSGKTFDGTAYGPSADVPTQAGTYTVTATVDETESYSEGTATKDFTIAKAPASTQDVRVAGVMSTDSAGNWVTGIEQPLAGMMPSDAGTLAYKAGEVTYAGGATTLPDGVSFTSGVDQDGKVTARLEIPSTATDIPEAVREITVPVTVTSKNYDDSTINVVVAPTKRDEKAVTIAGVPGSVTYGDDAFILTATVDDPGATANNWYWYSSNPDVLAVETENGSYQMQVHVRGAGSAQIMAWYEPSGGTTIGAAVTGPVTVSKARISPSVSIDGWTYGETANAPSVTGNTGNGAVTCSYSGMTYSGTSFEPSATAPTQAGTYTVTATVAETDNYLGDTCTKKFSIAPKKVPVTVIAEDKTYDGTTDANVIAVMKASDLVDGDLLEGIVVNDDGTVTFPGLKGSFDNSSAGQNKPITLDATGVTYPVEDVWSYEAEISEAPAASILPRPVYAKADDKTSKHGQAIAELTYSIDSSDSFSGLVGKDTPESLGITASTAASSSSGVGEYPITLSGGTGNTNYDVFFAEGGKYTITKADGLTRSINVMGVLSSSDADSAWVTSIEQPLAGMMPSDAGTLAYEGITTKYADGSTTLPEGVTSFTSNVDSDGKVTATLKIRSTATDIPEGVRKITLSVTVASENYEDSTINVIVVPTKRAEKAVAIEGAPAPVTYGDDAFTLTATVGGEQGEASGWYWYSSDPSVLEVANTGSNVMPVTVKNPGSAMILAWYEPSGGNTIGAALTASITVNKKSIDPSVSIEGWKYGEAPKAPALTEGSNPGGCTVTYEYKTKGADDSAYSEDVPFNAGDYTARATVPESTYHKGGACTADFTIAKIPVDATVAAKDKTYDGTTDANVSATVSAGLLEGDSVTVSGLSGTFADANVGEGKTVTIDRTGVNFTGEGAANYEVAIPETSTASIFQRSISIKADDKSSQYGQDIAALTCSPYGSTTLAKGDTIESLGITASTTATKSSSVGTYPITISGGTANPNYKVALSKDAGAYTIVPADISKAKVTLAQTSYTYDGSAKEPAVTSVVLGGRSLAADTDYAVSYKDNVEVGTATVTVAGKGNYKDAATATFAIEAAPEPKPEPSPEPEPSPSPKPEPREKTAPATWDRLWGETGLDTMVAIVNAGGFEAEGTVVLSTFDGYWDALAGAGIAGKLGAPVIMTPGGELSAQTRSLLESLRPARIVVCGGTAALPDAVADEAAAVCGSEVVRCWGDFAVNTAEDIAGKAQALSGQAWADTAFLCTSDGYWDALAAAPISYARNMPIFLAQGHDAVEGSTLDAMRSAGVRSVVIVGGEAAVSPAAERAVRDAGFDVAARLGGATAIETSEEVASYGLSLGMTADYMGVATAGGYWDALAGAPLCGRRNSVLVLAGSAESHSISGFIKEHDLSIVSAYVFGGEAAVDAATYDAIVAASATVPGGGLAAQGGDLVAGQPSL